MAKATESDDARFQKVVRHFLTTPPKPRDTKEREPDGVFQNEDPGDPNDPRRPPID